VKSDISHKGAAQSVSLCGRKGLERRLNFKSVLKEVLRPNVANYRRLSLSSLSVGHLALFNLGAGRFVSIYKLKCHRATRLKNGDVKAAI
jgi:hypothetical protein